MPSIAWPVWLIVVAVTKLSSGKPTTSASVEFFTMLMYWLVIGGMMMRRACGTMISFRV